MVSTDVPKVFNFLIWNNCRLAAESGCPTLFDALEATSPSGRYLFARHPDSTLVEYVQWKPELVQQFITARASRN